ncbi:MAG: pyrroline-5-carboxylate reductase [Thiomicrospira sp.]|jgi:pyrroline-5-carboxylate reductase|nr:pyrroline-5-carboxylate reductase [Thiomicrospira sp.]
MNATICFIGAGNMSRSLIGGLVASGYPAEQLCAADPNPASCQQFSEHLGIRCVADNRQALAQADIVVLAVKPQQLQSVCESLAQDLQQRRPLVISVAAGVTTEAINRWLGGEMAIVRTMPNTPALIQAGATGLFANSGVSKQQRDDAEHILRAAGLTLWLDDEAQLDAVTALSGSGPAYFFLFMEAMEQAAKTLGLDEKTARLLTLQTAFGASKMALESTDDCATLRRKVTSPNGTTERAIVSFEQDQLGVIVERAMHAAHQRAQQLAKELGGQL